MDTIDQLKVEINRLRASELAWQMIAKQNDRWNKLSQSEKETALQKALDAAVSENIKLTDETEKLREALIISIKTALQLADSCSADPHITKAIKENLERAHKEFGLQISRAASPVFRAGDPSDDL